MRVVFHVLFVLFVPYELLAVRDHCQPSLGDRTVFNYDASKEFLRADLSKVLKCHTARQDQGKPSNSSNVSAQASTTPRLLRLELIRMHRNRGGVRSCEDLKGSFNQVQSSVIFSASYPIHKFNYVQGRYFIRLSECSAPTDDSCTVVFCSKPRRLLPETDIGPDQCEIDDPLFVDADLMDNSRSFDLSSCDMEITAVVPLCTAFQEYHTATITPVKVGLGEHCTFAEYDQTVVNMTNIVNLQSCHSADCFELRDNATSDDNVTSSIALLRHQINGLSRNASYCLFFKLNNPHCAGRYGCLFYTETITCDLLALSPLSLFTEPMFIGVVSLTLFASLSLLMWTVVQCSKKRPDSPMQQPIKKPPRSLTEDDLEHIARLPSQEIVLVYFPDTKRFKDLNRKLRNWLITLDVNDVKDIYDEKCSEEVQKDPNGWVRSVLGGPEKRIILVCSRLAYECLVTIRKGLNSPKFVETDPHFGLLTRTLQYLDREMRGNYRNLICVRYEDLKICSRKFSSEAFNIVPGTEYVLPQHLEDVYRWIHPRDPKPECWQETRIEVKDLLDSMRNYRLHDDNIFTVQFSNGNGVAAAANSSDSELL